MIIPKSCIEKISDDEVNLEFNNVYTTYGKGKVIKNIEFYYIYISDITDNIIIVSF